MTGKLIIDGTDIFTTYGGYVTEGGYEGLIEFPDLKDVEKNDWPEEDGIEVDLSDPKLATKEFSLSMAFGEGIDKLNDFVKYITTGAVHSWNFADIGRTYNLRYVSSTDINNVGELRALSIKLADDSPLSGYSYAAPSSSYPVRTEDYELDEIPLSQYGVSILQGTLSEIEKIPSAKVNLLRTNNSLAGSVYDGDYVRFSEKEVKVKCLMRADTLSELWRNWDALLYNLSKPGERLLYTPNENKEYLCYYKKCKVSNFAASGKIWIDFEITLVFMTVIVEGEELVLQSENEFIIMTEDGQFAIDMSGNEQYLS